ncbi:ABC transporter ATP-binding protein [Egibacter rhizosphaerae]|uniref:ABC transporter ATP-binding protein n=1 Tax=Egibacter rhizosphaerae TaxID=1670831 RepID=A0A411YC80_9ACTN|nr:ABC transporter ATP-binding protein [Egibacter rhizosphaerae]QBI18810.1 ABC transporter ATP-binding protein [Egibacter rhizosphaerae]
MAAENAAIWADEAEVVFRRRGRPPVCAVSGLGLDVPAGTVFCLLGPNGSGKTTVVNLLVGLLRPTRGAVAVAGMDPHRQRREVLRRVAVVPQETALYEELTGRENLEFHARYYGVTRAAERRRIDAALELVSLEGTAGERVGTYSGGMRRRLLLARALLTDPSVIVLDEPTLGVDVQSRQAIWERIDALADEGRTILLTTNLMEEAERLGRDLLVIDEGRPVAAGTPGELKATVAQRTVRLQASDEPTAANITERFAGLSAQRSGIEVRVAVPTGDSVPSTLRALLDAVESDGHALEGIAVDEPSLHDVFLRVTGRALRDRAVSSPALPAVDAGTSTAPRVAAAEDQR